MPNTLQRVLLVSAFNYLILAQSVNAEGNILINEIFVHPGAGSEWVEIYNPDETDITGYWIDDDSDFGNDSGNSSKKSLSNVNQDNRKYMHLELSSVFNNSGDKVVLFDSSGNIVDQYEYTNDPGIDVTIGRSPDGSGQFAQLSSPTKGQVNSGIAPTPIPTSQPTPTPTKVPTPTKSPTPTKIPTPGKSIYSATSSKAPTLSPTTSKLAVNTTSKISPTKSASLSGIPTSILGIRSKAEVKKQVDDNENKTLVDSENKQNPTPFIIGAVLILACGILVLRNRLKNRHV